MKEKQTTKLKPTKWRTIKVKVPVCPICNANMTTETSLDARTMWSWKCTNPTCNYKY